MSIYRARKNKKKTKKEEEGRSLHSQNVITALGKTDNIQTKALLEVNKLIVIK